jgi:hypothetical protein
MYYIPKGKPMHEKLSTTFVRMDGLLEELKAENFSGYILLAFPNLNGFIFVQDGSVVNAAEVVGNEHRSGVAVKEHLFTLTQQSKGTLSVYHIQKEIVQTLSGIADGEKVYENLSTDWANLGKLIQHLSADKKTYFFSVAFSSAENKRGMIFVEGDKVEAICSIGDEQNIGKEALDKILADCEIEPAQFTLYRQATSPITKIDTNNIDASINQIAAQAVAPNPAPAPVVTAPEPVKAEAPAPIVVEAAAPVVTSSAPAATAPAAYYDTLLPSGNHADAGVAEIVAEAKSVEAKPKPVVFDDVLDAVEAKAVVAPVAVPVLTASAVSAAQLTPAPLPEVPKSGNEMRDLMNLMSQVVAAVEQGMGVAGRGSSFPTALRAGLLAVTERYPFLDPFAAEFEYQDKEIVFVGTAQPNEFATGLTEALRQMVEDLIYSSNGRVRDYIAEELRKVEQSQSNDIRRFNLGSLTEKICQH